MALFKTFGKNPAGKELLQVEKSKHYKDRNFQNLSETLLMADKASMLKTTWKFLNKPKYTVPSSVLPSVKTNLQSFGFNEPVIVWFGHSSYLIHIGGKNILVDPVLSGHASPFTFGAKSFPGSDVYNTDDFPFIDLLIITHDHYDHLDSRTIVKMKDKIGQVATSLGVRSHFVYWGFDENKITELDWWDSKIYFNDFKITAAPARHFSGRTFERNKTLWSSFILEADGYKMYIGGDSGYDSHFKTIGEKFGPFDIAMLESGQYNEQWPDIHMMPEETVLASVDLNAKWLLPVHWSKFSLSLHPWNEPVKRVLAKARELNVNVTTPTIGEPVILNRSYPNKHWWTGL